MQAITNLSSTRRNFLDFVDSIVARFPDEDVSTLASTNISTFPNHCKYIKYTSNETL